MTAMNGAAGKASPSASRALVRGRGDWTDSDDDFGPPVIQKPQENHELEGGSQGGQLVKAGTAKAFGGLKKLQLMADHLQQTAVGVPFRFEELKKVADSQLDAHMDDIDALHDVSFFHDDILIHIEANVESPPAEHGQTRDGHSADVVAAAISARIHNAHLGAASWYQIRRLLQDLEEVGVNDANVRNKIHQRPVARQKYLLLYDMAQRVAEMERRRLARVAATSEYFSKYFTREKTKDGAPSMAFNEESASDAYRNLVDLLVIQLALPDKSGNSGYSLPMLYAMLHEALADDRQEESKLSQELNDAIGDLSTVVQFLDMLDVPLYGSESQNWKTQSPVLTPEIEQYFECQRFSREALLDNKLWDDPTFQQHVWPLESTKDEDNLEKMWEALNKNSNKLFGVDLETLWGLQYARQPSSQWTFSMPTSGAGSEDSSGHVSETPHYDPYERALVPLEHKKVKDKGKKVDKSSAGKKPLLLSDRPHNSTDAPLRPAREEESDDDEMPNLMSMSESSEYDDEDEIDSDTDDDDETGRLIVGVIGSLSGRSVSLNPVESTCERASTPYNHKLEPAPRLLLPYGDSQGDPQQQEAPNAPAAGQKSKVTVEAEEDIEAEGTHKKKKKKPKKKKTGKAPATSSPTAASTASIQVPATANLSNGSSLAPQKQSTARRSDLDLSAVPSFPVGETSAQSMHSYRRAEQSEVKAKNKTRPDPSVTNQSQSSRVGRNPQEEPAEEKEQKSSLQSRWKQLLRGGAKNTDILRRIIRSADQNSVKMTNESPMTWHEFLKGMWAVGFEIDLTPAGSAVRFDPPNKEDRSISFHKPHPGKEIRPKTLMNWARRLKRHYGWVEEDFKSAEDT